MAEGSTDLKLLMRCHQLIVAACNDPDLDRDATLFVVCTIVLNYESKTSATGRLKRRNWLRTVTEMSGGDPYFVRKVIRHDIPRYDCPLPEKGCTAPMIRREGLCGKQSVVRGVQRDPITGVATPYAFCSRHRNHADDWRIRQSNREWEANGRPSPAPNAGGILRRYFTADWDHLYRWAAPYMTPLDGEKPPVVPRPTLRLIQGGE
ncbi:hypothetical protein RSPPQCQH_CDS0081 [Mycolicibacterium phage phi1_186001]